MDHPFTISIKNWYAKNRRDLPWRRTKDPYHVWISEIILQQTRVAQGYLYYKRFIDRFPTIEALATAEEDEVMKIWQGLGYYNRARNLHAAAKEIMQHGSFPTTFEGIRKLSGIGDYTAAAIASFCFELPHAVVDGNVYRVLARYFGISTPIDTTAGKKEFAQLANALFPKNGGSDYNQGIMDFGALQCTPQSPDCTQCPIGNSCFALSNNSITSLPVKAKRASLQTKHLVYLYMRTQTADETYIYLHKRAKGDIWQGLYEPYVLEFDHSPSPSEVMHRVGFEEGTWKCLQQGVKHILSHRILFADFYLISFIDKQPDLPADFIRIKESERDSYAVSRLVSLCYEKINNVTPERNLT